MVSFVGEINSESESQTGNSGSEENVTLKDSGKNHSSHNGNSFGSHNGTIERPTSPSKDQNKNRTTNFKKNLSKKTKNR